MQLTQHTDFGLRLLIELARRGGGPVTLPDFAASQNLSYHHVAKVSQELAHAGFTVSRRGRSGGVELARPAADITVGEVVRALERFRMADCASCAMRDDCATSGLLDDALDAFLAVLDRKTLAEAAVRGLRARTAFPPA